VCRLYCQVFVECVIHNLSFRNYDLIGLYVAGLYFTTAEACHFAWRGFMSSISNASFTAISPYSPLQRPDILISPNPVYLSARHAMWHFWSWVSSEISGYFFIRLGFNYQKRKHTAHLQSHTLLNPLDSPQIHSN